VVSINGDKATGTSYCQVTLISKENGEKMKTVIGAIYEDIYLRSQEGWLVARRQGNFEWQEKIAVD